MSEVNAKYTHKVRYISTYGLQNNIALKLILFMLSPRIIFDISSNSLCIPHWYFIFLLSQYASFVHEHEIQRETQSLPANLAIGWTIFCPMNDYHHVAQFGQYYDILAQCHQSFLLWVVIIHKIDDISRRSWFKPCLGQCHVISANILIKRDNHWGRKYLWSKSMEGVNKCEHHIKRIIITYYRSILGFRTCVHS
jgi:hypothetical protein